MRRPNLAAIRRRLEAATGGVWKTGNRFGAGVLGSHVVVMSGKLPPLELASDRNGRNDAAFIAHAHQDVPAMLSEIERLRAEIEHYRNEWTIEGDSAWLWLTRILDGEQGDHMHSVTTGSSATEGE